MVYGLTDTQMIMVLYVSFACGLVYATHLVEKLIYKIKNGTELNESVEIDYATLRKAED